MGSNAGGTRLGQWLTILVLVIGIIVLIGLVLPNFIKITDRGGKEAEAKANLHDIQLSVERYATDHGGEYPAYLIGGEPKWAAKVQPDAGGPLPQGFSGISDCDPAQVSDPLLRAGYIDAYPRNPFVRDGLSVQRMQDNLPTSLTGNDPLRNGAPEAQLLGTRFGPYGVTMGQVLCDPRYPQWQFLNPAAGKAEPRDTWATVEYRFWDMWLDKRGSEPYLMFSPGQFFYKSMGTPVLPESFWKEGRVDESTPILPRRSEFYVMGAYGDTRHKGQDVIGEEIQDTYGVTLPDGRSMSVPYWPWIRSQCSVREHHGSPFSCYPVGGIFGPGCSNGIPDGVALLLYGGEYPSEG